MKRIILKIAATLCVTWLLMPSLWAQAIGQTSVASWDFGPTLVGCTSSPKNIALFNTGNAQLVMNTISINGPFALPVNHCANGVKPGTHCNVSVTYSATSLATDNGTLIFNDNASNTPQIVTLSGHGATIVPTSSTTFGASPTNSVYYGQTITLSGKVASLGGCSIPNGELMNFHNDQGFVYCTAPIGGTTGVASCTAQIFLKPGIYTVRAAYPGDSRFEPSTSTNNAGGLYVFKWQTTTTLNATPNPANVGQTVTITATVSSAGPYMPTGNVNFYVNGTYVRHASLTNGTAQTSYTFTTAGNWSITAKYNGDAANHNSAGGFAEIVNP